MSHPMDNEPELAASVDHSLIQCVTIPVSEYFRVLALLCGTDLLEPGSPYQSVTLAPKNACVLELELVSVHFLFGHPVE